MVPAKEEKSGENMTANEMTAKAQILIHKPCLEVFNAIIDPKIMSKYWFARNDKGLGTGKRVIWYVGTGKNAFEIEVHVKSIKAPSLLLFEWGCGVSFTEVSCVCEQQTSEQTKLVIEERGFKGSHDEIVSQALDSTCGFNQAIVALKALLEHNVTINVVEDHV